jgi:multiple sugar transport system ATP-binding protein
VARVTLENLTKRYRSVLAVDRVSLEADDGEFMVLVGPSGCGKTTVLRMIAGLEEVDEGEICIGGKMVNDLSPKDRDIAMVFQNYALYPHMTAFDNMAFGLRLRRTSGREIETRVAQVARLLGIEALLGRRPKQLSGGERQRVALGRAIVRQPKVFLMDEPLSNLDAKLRAQTRLELIKLHRRLGVTTIYVTHDQVEAMTMGQRIAVMRDGRVQQVATPTEIYAQPANMFVAGFVGSPSMNLLPATVRGGALDFGAFCLGVAEGFRERLTHYLDKKVTCGIRPEDLAPADLSPIPEDGSNSFRGMVDVVEPMGSTISVYIRAGEHLLVGSFDARANARPGEEIGVVVDLAKTHVFDTETEQALF